ncbi:MAG: putative toxin-antitoxin system toxin component, PIN family [SAR324 cluster bacterium]|nr:putative toxin-antitoxin system toxin component, PIN family [SAR324 cluster bacterium]
MRDLIVIDTNVFISALLNPFGESAIVLELCFQGQYHPLMGTALFFEYEDVLSRDPLFKKCLLDSQERDQALNDFISISKWTRVYYSWRPNLKDEGDNHLMELAIAGGAKSIVTRNVKDFKQPDLSFPDISILTPKQFLEDR